jgi:hypothetical protein
LKQSLILLRLDGLVFLILIIDVAGNALIELGKQVQQLRREFYDY